MFEILSSIFKFIFILIIYVFIFGIIRLIYLDIKSLNDHGKKTNEKHAYLKLINRREKLDFKVHESYIIDKDKTLGRASKNEIVIQDPFLSGRHVRFLSENNTYFLEDLESTNGSFVNDTRAGNEPVVLKNGDRIHIGQLDFIFVQECE
ncbi:FHA domain-containing protein [Petroclostridium sp. X23]|uniref:FHA domain-containing protein n=1 Tax=Petroclostridium sp. X23 TaxID=3045146 RepID=UPI0024AE51D0|nr:FHA domain-containing protein [Petroclostridium sp. X23]WHH59353.1 FHA domain-containing protein [Petroclostridium sp. X23]